MAINFESEGEKTVLNVEQASNKALDMSLREIIQRQSFDRKSYSTQPIDKSRNNKLKAAKTEHTELLRNSVHGCYANDTAKKNTWSRNIIFHKSAARLNLDSSLQLTMTKIGDPPASSLDEDEYPNFGPRRGAKPKTPKKDNESKSTLTKPLSASHSAITIGRVSTVK